MSRNPNPHDHSAAPHREPISLTDSGGDGYVDGESIERRTDALAPPGSDL